jgi:hypothetical protein
MRGLNIISKSPKISSSEGIEILNKFDRTLIRIGVWLPGSIYIKIDNIINGIEDALEYHIRYPGIKLLKKIYYMAENNSGIRIGIVQLIKGNKRFNTSPWAFSIIFGKKE